MSDSLQLQDYIRQLEEHAKPNKNDNRYMSYVKYINAFLSVFGKERAYLVGSTGEQLKLRSSTYGGDADFIICSGRLEIPIDNIEERDDLPCYVRVIASNLRSDIRGNLIDEVYLSADILRHVSPELFTILRAIYTEATATADRIPGRESRLTTTGVPMKVGLGRKQFRHLEIEGVVLPLSRSDNIMKRARSAKVAAELKKRRRDVQLNVSDMNMFQRILKVIKMAKVPGSNGENHGQINEFAYMLDEVMNRIPLEQELDPERADDGVAEGNGNWNELQDEGNYMVKATFSEMTSTDFIPALRITGNRKMKWITEWSKRVEKAHWPPRKVSEEICKLDIFLVARDAPINPDIRTDFCLSFNLAELELARCLSIQQCRVYLILKSYLNGIMKRQHKDLCREMKLKSYYLKSALFWVCERECETLWAQNNTIPAVLKVLDFLDVCMKENNLPHYFVQSNLLADLEKLDRDNIRQCIEEIMNNPIQSIGEFKFKIENDHTRGEIWLSADEVRCITQMTNDGGTLDHLDKLEDEMIDMQRGFNESPRDANGIAPIKEAILKAFDVFLEEERQKIVTRDTSNESLGDVATGSIPQALSGSHVSQAAGISSLLNTFVTGGGNQSLSSRQTDERMNFLLQIGSMIPGGSEFITEIGGRNGVHAVLQQSANQATDHRAELRLAIDKYLSCCDEAEDAVGQELKQKLTAYFIEKL